MARLGQIHIFVGMLMHGHGDRAYAHYATTFWLRDLNFTILSICLILRALERPFVMESKVLFFVPLENFFFEALMHGKSRCMSLVPSADRDPTPPLLPRKQVIPLPRKLFLQLDNSTKDIKNRFEWHFFHYWLQRVSSRKWRLASWLLDIPIKT